MEAIVNEEDERQEGDDGGRSDGAGDDVGQRAAAGLVAAGGRRAIGGLVKYVAALATTAIIGSVAVWLWPQAQPMPVVGMTPTPEIQPAPADIRRPALQVVEVQAQETEADRIIMEILGRLTTAVDNLAAEVHAGQGAQQQTAIGAQMEAVAIAPTPAPEATPQLSVWEDGACWTPADMPVLQLCGADPGDGYVVRWMNLAGDSAGPQIPDADWLATRGGGDRLVWSGHHPASGEIVTVNYWSKGHVLAVHAAGRLLFRIDRDHRVLR